MNDRKEKWDIIAKNKLMGSRKDYRPVEMLVEVVREMMDCDTYLVADLGCYNAQDLIKMAGSFRNGVFIGYDISPSAIFAARKNIARSGFEERVKVFESDIEQRFSIPDRYYDVTITKYVLPLVQDKLSFLFEMKRITFRGVVLVVPVFDEGDRELLSRHELSVSLERGALHTLMRHVFGSSFTVRKVLKTRKRAVDIEVVVAKVNAD